MQLRPALERIGGTVDLLGESPVWDDRAQALWWVDVRTPCIRRHDLRDGHTASFAMPELVGSIGLRQRGGLVVALASAIALFDPGRGMLERIAAPEAGIAHRRFNDGRCDRQGRFWAGTMQDVTRAPEGTLYRLDADARCTPAFNGIRAPNSLAWSPDGRTMYFADSYLQAIFAYPFDPIAGTVGERRVFATLDGTRMPDGSTVDAEGFLWNAEYDGWRITRYAPDGRVDRTLHLPVQRPTSCAFGGPGLDVLYVTTACQRLTEAERAAQPLAGALLALDPGARGVAEPQFEG
jgi:sugar lactone lactonase YvrE